jgi:nicotinate-nucleotide adenylyltransferase
VSPDGMDRRPARADAGAPSVVRPAAHVVPGSIGILGGTFDPIHQGHLAIAEDAREQLGLERILFIPARDAPLRSGPAGASPEDRARMVELAVAGNPHFAVDRIELARPGPSYTVETLDTLTVRERDAGRVPDLWFVLSAEQLRKLPRWKAPERVLELCHVAVVPRPGVAMPDQAWLEAAFPGRRDRIIVLDGPLLPVSGTAVRERLAVGRSVRYLLPDTVIAYIEDHDLYRP